MKQFAYILSLLLALAGSHGSLKAVPLAIGQDTVTHYRYIIDEKTVQQFDGSQLVGKKILSYRISTIQSPSKGTIWVHDIRTDGKAQSDEPVYIIDGKQVSKRKFENLSPSGIKSITVIKNGSLEEVRQYPGWENGVILVETKPADRTALTKDSQINIGYGQMENQDLSYSVSSVKPEENEFYTNMYDYLRGRVAGVEVRTDNSIFIRGHSSMEASMQPLILLDGVEITDLSIINPYDVYSVDVLKDASSAIYGIKGANGVILITTKHANQDTQSSRKERKSR